MVAAERSQGVRRPGVGRSGVAAAVLSRLEDSHEEGFRQTFRVVPRTSVFFLLVLQCDESELLTYLCVNGLV